MEDPNEITFFAKTNYRNQERVFGIKTDDRRRHMYVIGKTGMGKTNMLENLAIQDIQKGHGIAFVDPHGDTAEKLIKAIPASRINDVIYFNPADQEFPVAFNVMEKVDTQYRHLVASGLVGVFKKIWADSWGPRLEYILRNAILALLEYPGSTLLGVTRILVDKSYRERVVEKITDPVVRSFWVDEFTQWNDRVLQEVISPIQNKVGQFLSSALIRNIVGQPVSSFDVRKLMDERKILIMNLSKGRMGEDNSALLGAMMITKIQLAAMARVDIEEETRKDFYLYVDEFQNFATESFANILSEARKYRLNLTLANQYVTQIDERVRDAIFGNAGSIVTFRVGAMDAEFLEKEFEPVFVANDLVNLPKYQIYLKLMIDGIAGDAFSATTLPPIKLEDAGNDDKIIAVSRERYASSKQDVEDKIRRWSGMLSPEELEALAKKPVQRFGNENEAKSPRPPKPPVRRENPQTAQKPQRTAAPKPRPAAESPISPSDAEAIVQEKPVVSAEEKQEERKLYAAECATCGTAIEVPFKPDGTRPTFCKDCLRDYQRATAKEKLRLEGRAENNTQKSSSHTHVPQPRRMQPAAYASEEAPMSLSQVRNIEPKKFKPLRKRPDVNVTELRELIKKAVPQRAEE